MSAARPSEGARSAGEAEGIPVSSGVVAFEGELSIYRAAELKPVVLEALAAEGDVTFDLGAVEEIDTAGVQLLLLAHRELASRGHALRIASPAPCVCEALAVLGLEEQLLARTAPATPGS